MIDLPVYTTLKDKCCLAYFGECEEYLLQLAYFRNHIENQLDGLKVYLGCSDSYLHFLRPYQNVLSMDEIRMRKHEFGYFREILCDIENHPIEQLLVESGISWTAQHQDCKPENNRCLIISRGKYPTNSLTEEQVLRLMDLAVNNGLKPEFGDDPTDVGHVWGVESWQLWKHASQVSQEGSLLVPTGLGAGFYRRTFPYMKLSDFQ